MYYSRTSITISNSIIRGIWENYYSVLQSIEPLLLLVIVLSAVFGKGIVYYSLTSITISNSIIHGIWEKYSVLQSNLYYYQ